MSQLTFFAEEPLVSHSASQDCEKDWMIHVATSCSPLVPLLQNIAPNGWYGRTSPAFSLVTPDKTLQAFWASSLAKSSKSPNAAGAAAALSPASLKPMAFPIGCWTLSTLEYPSGAVVCSLSDVLETGEVPQRFFLSKRALKGIAQRDGVRGQFTLVSRQKGHALSMTERAMCWKSKASAQQPHLSMSD